MNYGFTLYSRHPPWKFCHAIDTTPAEHTTGDCQTVFYCVGTGAYGCLLGELASHISVKTQTYQTVPQNCPLIRWEHRIYIHT